jgi:tetratricopeptide (TPR) repeat protein
VRFGEKANLEKAIEIKRRAQRCVQNGDLDGALSEYEKLIASDDSDPYNFVLIADLLYKKSDQQNAGLKYLAAAGAYEKAALYKNAIAVCKKMVRLSLAPVHVYQRLAALHALDGLSTEASLYYVQHAELLIRDNQNADAAKSLRLAFDTSTENIKALERLAELLAMDGHNPEAARTLIEASENYLRAGQKQDADRCRRRARQFDSTVSASGAADAAERPAEIAPGPAAPAPIKSAEVTEHFGGPARLPDAAPPHEQEAPVASSKPSPPRLKIADLEREDRPVIKVDHEDLEPVGGLISGPPRLETDSGYERGNDVRMEPLELESGRYDGPAPVENETEPEPESVSAGSPASPGLKFNAALPSEPAPVAASNPLTEVERMLARAQECFRNGQREAASDALAGAARAYDALGRHDSAATIYRSLGKSAHASTEILELWLANCETRDDRVEAAQVACELGDRALNDGHPDDARRWFERARKLDTSNDLSMRRLQRLNAAPGGVATVASAAPAEIAPAAPGDEIEKTPLRAQPGLNGEVGRVEVAVGRGEAVTFDLGSLISEFQRGVEAQLSGDAQSHYDLAMSYREMGLLEQAVESFRVAAEDPAYLSKSAEMIGRCMLDQGRFDDAAREFATALSQPVADTSLLTGLRYQLGLAHEAAGRTREALEEFERVYAAQANYPDVSLKIRVLRKTLESS